MYSFPNSEPLCCSVSSSNYYFFICIHVSQDAGKVVWYSHLLKNFPQFVVIHTVKGFSIVNKAEVDVLLEFSCFLDYNPTDAGNLISGSSAFSKSRLTIWKFTVRILLKPGLGNFEHYFASIWSEVKWSCSVVVRLFAAPWTVAYTASLSMEFSRQEYWSGVPLPSPLQSTEEVKSLSHVWLFVTPWTVAYQAPQFMEFSR